AQQGTRGAAAAPALQPDPTLSSEDQLAPSQMRQRVPAAVAEPTGGSHTTAHPVMHTAAAPPHPAEPKLPPPSAHVVACTGIFSQSSNALRLAMTFDYKNVTFGDVDADGGTKVKASIVFPNDPKRRLEVWWSNPAERSGTYLIDIKGKSTWGAPGGMRLGLDLMQMEKLNKKPFKLKGFDKNGVATVSDWDGGALAALAGGCKSGVNLSADPKAAADAVSAMSADKEYSSSDPAMRSLKPTVSEILIGY
ncbi:MAG: hypothetical protein WBF27_14500, partial [Xanthobacteraceae bacterium]